MSRKTRDPEMSKEKKQAEQQPSITDFAVAEDQLAHLREVQGETDEKHHNPLWRLIDRALRYREERIKQPVRKKTYLWLCLLGAFGAHRFLCQAVDHRGDLSAYLLDRVLFCHDHHRLHDRGADEGGRERRDLPVKELCRPWPCRKAGFCGAILSCSV